MKDVRDRRDDDDREDHPNGDDRKGNHNTRSDCIIILTAKKPTLDPRFRPTTSSTPPSKRALEGNRLASANSTWGIFSMLPEQAARSTSEDDLVGGFELGEILQRVR